MILLAILLGLYLAVLLGIGWVSQRPFRIPIFLSPGAMGVPQEEVAFDSEDGIPLRGWWLDRPDCETVAIFAHGYMMNRAEMAPQAVEMWNWGCSCLLFDFRAHGRSGKAKSGIGYYERKDVAAAVRFARLRYPNAKIVLLGSSMGASASALALADDPGLADALVFDSGYSKLSSAILGWWRFLGGKKLQFLLAPTPWVAAPFVGFNPFRIDVARALESVSHLPILMFHGDCDDLVLPEEAQRNKDAAGANATFVWLARCGHTEGRWVHPELYFAALKSFLEEHRLLRESCDSSRKESVLTEGRDSRRRLER